MIEKERLEYVSNKRLEEYQNLKNSSNTAIGVLMAQQVQLQKQINSHANAVLRYNDCIMALRNLKNTGDEKFYYEWLDLCVKSYEEEQEINMNDKIVVAYIASRLGMEYSQLLMEKLQNV